MEWLKEVLGEAYNEEIVTTINANVGKNFVDKTRYNELSETKKTLETRNKELLDSLETLKAQAGKGSDLENTIKTMQEDFEKKQQDLIEQMKKDKIAAKIELALTKKGAVNVKAVKALLDAEKITLDGDEVIGLEDQLSALMESEKWAFNSATQPTQPNNPPAGTKTAQQTYEALKAEVLKNPNDMALKLRFFQAKEKLKN